MSEDVPKVNELAKKIESRGFWKVIIRPLKFEKERLGSLKNCADLVQQCRVVLRGWDYPHINRRHDIKSGLDWVENATDWNGYKELWRMYQSGQFFHLFGCREDWFSERTPVFGPSRYSELPPGSILSILSTLYSVTEIYEFGSRLAQKGLFDNMIYLSIELHRMRNRKLVFLDPLRSLFDQYVCGLNELPKSNTLTVEDILGKGHDLALDHAIWIFERFNWLSPPREILREDQKKFLERRI